MTNELEVLGLFLEEYVKAKEEMNGVDSVMNDIFVTDKTSIHVFEGDELVGIYTKETGVPKIYIEEEPVEEDGSDRDGDILDKDWAQARNREIEEEVRDLREILSNNYVSIGNNKVIRRKISELLQERDDITYKYGLAGAEFNKLYGYKQEKLKSIEELNGADTDGDKDLLDPQLLAKCESQEEYEIVIEGEEGNYTAVEQKKPKGLCRPNWQASEFNRITKEMVELYSRKNTDYGGSFDESLDEDGLLVAKIRMNDKLNRFSQLIDNDGLVEDESLRDTLIDLANYSVMTIMWLDDEKD